MTRKIISKGGLEWIGCRARSTAALVRDLRAPESTVEHDIYSDIVAASLLMDRATKTLEKALGMKS